MIFLLGYVVTNTICFYSSMVEHRKLAKGYGFDSYKKLQAERLNKNNKNKIEKEDYDEQGRINNKGSRKM